MGAAGTHRVTVNAQRADATAATPLQGFVDSEAQGAIAAVQVLEQQYQQNARGLARRPHRPVEHLMVAGVVASIAATHDAQRLRHRALAWRQYRAHQQHLGFAPGWVAEQCCEGNENGYNGIGQGEHGWTFCDIRVRPSYPVLMLFLKNAQSPGSTDRQDLAAQRQALLELGVAEDSIYTDHGLTGTTRARPGLDQALAAVREGDTLVVPKLDRLARSVPDARAIADRLRERGVKLALGRALYDPGDPMAKMFFNILATFAEFEADLIRTRTREGMAIARARGKLHGKQPKVSDRQQRELCRMHATGEYSISDLAELFSVSRPTVYRTLNRRLSP